MEDLPFRRKLVLSEIDRLKGQLKQNEEFLLMFQKQNHELMGLLEKQYNELEDISNKQIKPDNTL